MPVPSGIFIPVFKIGAALGRAVGEAMALQFPNGVRYGYIVTPIVPGELIIFQYAIKYFSILSISLELILCSLPVQKKEKKKTQL